MAKKLQIRKNEDAEVRFIGISSLMKDFRLAHTVNQCLRTRLSRQKPISLYREKTGNSSLHSFYTCNDEVSRLTFDLIRNKGEEGFALSGKTPMDYVLVIQGRLSDSEAEAWITKLRREAEVLLVLPLSLNAAEREGLMADLEIHHSQIGSRPEAARHPRAGKS